ncbi:hypothetical protein M1349_05960 [Patescibacteria group bacterium]|nr:hypothetical protein [Patescibacteria group bacterium]
MALLMFANKKPPKKREKRNTKAKKKGRGVKLILETFKESLGDKEKIRNKLSMRIAKLTKKSKILFFFLFLLIF